MIRFFRRATLVAVASALCAVVGMAAPPITPAQLPEAGKRVDVYIDVSASIKDTAGFNGQVSGLVAGIPRLLCKLGSGRHEINVVTWGSTATDIWTPGRAFIVDVPQLQTRTPRPRRSEADMLNASGFARRVRAYEADSLGQEALRAAAVAASFAPAARAIQRQATSDRIAAASRTGGCTSIAALGARLRDARSVAAAIVMTDARHTCNEPLVTPDEIRYPVAVLTCPSGYESSREFLRRVDVMRRLLPQAMVTAGEIDWEGLCLQVGTNLSSDPAQAWQKGQRASK